jgi:2-(1,2-epoxy-1,2-dihydrophenyl)acetyl-CoA isomerase
MDEKSESNIKKSIEFQVENKVAWITIDNQKKGNGLTPDMRNHLIDLFESFNGQFEIRSAVITGAGEKFFCTGADLSASSQNNDRSEKTPSPVTGQIRRMMLDGSIKLMNSVLDCEIPVIASVNGTAAGIGAHLAFCSDLVITSETARFIEIFARRGLVPDGLGAVSEVITRSLQNAKCAPIPAAVPFTDAITGISQSKTEFISLILPSSIILRI